MDKRTKRLVLLRVRELLARRRGWTKGAYSNQRPEWQQGDTVATACESYSFCLAGAVQVATYEVENLSSPYAVDITHDLEVLGLDALAAARLAKHPRLQQKAAEDGGSVFTFNDAKSTRKRDVLAVVDEALAGLEG